MSSLTKPGARGAVFVFTSAQKRFSKWERIPKPQSSGFKTASDAGSASSDAPILLFK